MIQDRKFWSEILPIIKEWCENKETILKQGHIEIETATFDQKPNQYSIEYREKIYTVNEEEVPAPETKIPAPGTLVYIPDPINSELVRTLRWLNGGFNTRLLDDGLVYRRKKDAIKRVKAMIKHKIKYKDSISNK